MDETLECEKLKFKVNFKLCKMDEVVLIFGDTFFEAHIMAVRQKLTWLVVCRDGEEVALKKNRSFMAVGSKLNLASLQQLDDERFVVVMQVGPQKIEE